MDVHGTQCLSPSEERMETKKEGKNEKWLSYIRLHRDYT